MIFSIELSSSSIGQIQKDILKEFHSYMSKVFQQALPVIKAKTITIIEDALKASPTWLSLIQGGELSEFLCIPSPANSLYQLEKAVLNSFLLTVKDVKISGLFITGGIEIDILSDSYAEILGAPDTSYITANGKIVPWLEWLLFYGTSPVVEKAKLVRTKRGTILVSDKDNLYIPRGHSGSPSDNFLTRALLPIEAVVAKMAQDEIRGRA